MVRGNGLGRRVQRERQGLRLRQDLFRHQAGPGVCPEGWHLPDTTEWNALEKFVADSLYNGKTDSVGYALKSTSGWTAYNGKTGGSDYFGFGALPAGGRDSHWTFVDVQNTALFWGSPENSANYAYSRYLGYDGTDLSTPNLIKYDARSVRCVKD